MRSLPVPAVLAGYAEWQRVGFRGFCLSRLGKTTVRNGKNHNGRSTQVPAGPFAPVCDERRQFFERKL